MAEVTNTEDLVARFKADALSVKNGGDTPEAKHLAEDFAKLSPAQLRLVTEAMQKAQVSMSVDKDARTGDVLSVEFTNFPNFNVDVTNGTTFDARAKALVANELIGSHATDWDKDLIETLKGLSPVQLHAVANEMEKNRTILESSSLRIERDASGYPQSLLTERGLDQVAIDLTTFKQFPLQSIVDWYGAAVGQYCKDKKPESANLVAGMLGELTPGELSMVSQYMKYRNVNYYGADLRQNSHGQVEMLRFYGANDCRLTIDLSKEAKQPSAAPVPNVKLLDAKPTK